jgi:translin
VDELLERLGAARERLEAKDDRRDRMLQQRRELTSTARTVVTRAHAGDPDAARAAYVELSESVDGIREDLDGDPDLWTSGALRNALQEVAEAWAVLRMVGEPVELPSAAVTDEALVLGLGDAVGEARRLSLDALIEGRVEDAVDRLRQMEQLAERLAAIDVSSGVVDHRHKVDVARQLVDKTRGKIAMARIEERLAEHADAETMEA